MSKELDELKTIDEIRTKHTKYHTTGIANGTIEMDEAYFFSLIHIAKSSLQKLEQEKENINLKLLKAKKDGFFDGYSIWRNDEFIIDYDTVRNEFCLRSITNAYTLGKTRFYESDYRKTWWLREDKSE